MKPRTFSTSSAFTLVELLTVIVIIAILAGLLMPVLAKITESANSTKCMANLRQIGAAMNGYANEHDDRLPGPLSLVQYPSFGTDAEADKGSLPRLLARYLDLAVRTDAAEKGLVPDRANVFTCPSYEKAVPKKDGPCYMLNAEKMTGYGQTPWGDVAVGGEEALKRNVLAVWTEDTKLGRNLPVNVTQVWALKDADLEAFKEAQTKPDGHDKMAKLPVHGDHRNALFYDWHVARMPLDDREFTVQGKPGT